ncbi:MAG: response regulator [bacterium]|nr:response regulator [bacterium]
MNKKNHKYKYPFSISRKIWLSLSILIIGYLASMIFGFIRGSETETRLHRVSESVFPAAMLSKVVLTRFNDQVKLYNDAVVFGEEGKLKDAAFRAREAQTGLKRLIRLVGKGEAAKYAVGELLRELTGFSARAEDLYAGMLLEIDNETLTKRASAMTGKTKMLRRKLTALTQTFANLLKSELVNISDAGRNQRYWTMNVFFIVVFLSFLLVSILISRVVTRPLQKAAALATAMAEGDLSRKLEIHQKDEIGGLARAMNIMAGKIEASHTLLEQKVNQRTISLEVTNDRLREEIEERERTAEELEKARDQLVETARLAEKASKSKSEFLANMSHEIRTPLTGVIGMTELLMYTSLTMEQKDYIETINVSSETLLTIINDILDLSKIEAGEYTLASVRFDLKRAVNGVVRIMTPQVDKKKLVLRVRFQPGISYQVVGDQVRVRQIFFNLAGNAVKFTHEGEVTISVNYGKHQGNIRGYHIEIADTGIGIEPAGIDTIFDKFTQVDSSDTRKYSGTGLGLSVTRQLVDLMKGTIRVESTPGKGSVFHVFLPLPLYEDVQAAGLEPAEKKTGEAMETNPVNPAENASVKILLAEDNRINRKLIRAIIKRAGYNLELVENGKAALEKVKIGNYDMVLMDIQMPEMNGLDATMAIRNAGLRDIPIIAMTASAFEKDKKMCMEAGMNDFISKPLKQAPLLGMIARWLQKK